MATMADLITDWLAARQRADSADDPREDAACDAAETRLAAALVAHDGPVTLDGVIYLSLRPVYVCSWPLAALPDAGTVAIPDERDGAA